MGNEMTDEEHGKAIDDLLARMVARLRDAHGNPAKVKSAIEQYLQEGDALEMSPLELRDYFDISSPGLPETAGFTSSESNEASELFDEVGSARYGT